jgi:radical SAM protein with 4Fe4S-binding SPASM domain
MFSVIMPVWNRTQYVVRAIESVLGQTLTDFELIIVDDGSEDGLEAVVQPFLSDKVLYHPLPHRGVSAARNYALRRATHDFIAYLDSDNTWHPDYLAAMAQALTSGDVPRHAAYCCFNLFKKDGTTGEVYLDSVRGKPFDFQSLIRGNYIDLNAFTHSRRSLPLVDPFDENLARLEDWDFILRLTSKFEPLFVPRPLLDYYLGVADNAIGLTEDRRKPIRYVRKKNRRLARPVRLSHDTIRYTWAEMPAEKHYNWIRSNSRPRNTVDYTAYSYPVMLQIEVTNLCNLACPLCPAGRNELNRERRNMTLDEFRSIVDDMERYLLLLVLWDWGEPFLNPDLPAMIRYAEQRDIRTVTSTNAQFLDDEHYLKEILTSGLTTLIVAIDSLDEDSYQIYRRNADLGRAVSGLKRLVRLKREVRSETLINLRVVVMKQNEHEVGSIRRMARRVGADWFTLKTLNPSCGSTSMDEELLPSSPTYRRYIYDRSTGERVRCEGKCRFIFAVANIQADGGLVPCTYDYDARMKVGNVFDTPLTELWNSPASRELRRKVCEEPDALDHCRDCGVNYRERKKGWFPESRDLRFSPLRRLARKLRF